MNLLSSYASIAKLVGLGLVVASLMGLGGWIAWEWQAGNVAKAEQAATEARTERDRWQANAQGYQSAIEQQKAANEAAQQAAVEQQAKAAKATKEAKAERDRYQRRLAEIEAGIEHDKTDPSCKAELERNVCGAPWQ